MFFFTAVSCKPIQYKQSIDVSLPELGTLGIYSSYVLGNDYQPKTIADLSGPIRLQWEEIKMQKRNIFIRKDSLSQPQKDSTLVSFKILDKVGLLKQINADKDLMKYLRKNEKYKLVSQVTVHFPEAILQQVQSSDEIYLTQNKKKTLSLSLLKNNKIFNQIEFTDGKIVKFKTTEFCWGLNKRREPEIFDLVPEGTECSGETYKSAKKVEKKNEFKF
ncbi:hypothetical protein [Aequorivita sp. CIP111184]|uniref:hypothetical protein n=1 Tax=Aequorivita sp. CIP111184 TaxID=2211356 RepID=UPI000DBC3A92|nr:hypothetical protein [Aequorivita sp. CIP111184]SRX52242.1 hypothetical protein AEQU1_00105 [Aequorivita sp. CIP111184]